MATITLNNNRIIGDYLEPYYVAEVNSSHNGNIELAKEMIIKAKEIGCDCVKFQSWSQESLYSKSYYVDNPIAKRIVGKFALHLEQQKELALFCKEVGIDFASTPYSKEEVDFLLGECDVPYIKIASMDINNYDLIDYVARKKTAIVLATGMADEAEIKKAVEVIKMAGNDCFCLLHCISLYPADVSMMQLNNMLGFRELFPDTPIGLSDHTIGSDVASASVALGSCMVEKHFTLDKKKMGMDNNMATEPDDFLHMISSGKNVFAAMGSFHRQLLNEEIEQRKKMRRSIVAARDLKSGETIQREDLDAKRPGDGISVADKNSLIGKTLVRDIEQDMLILLSDVE